MKITEITLRTNCLNKLRPFYTETLGFELTEQTVISFSIRVGSSMITFVEDDSPHYHHFAFNIPSFQIKEALAWLKTKVTVLTDDDKEIIDFPNWNAEAIYFLDPAQNVVELIARKNLGLKTLKPFDQNSILGLSEMGIPAENVQATYLQLASYCGLQKYSGDFNRFCAVGDEIGLFIIVDQEKKQWFPTSSAAKSFPFTLTCVVGEKSFYIQHNGEKMSIINSTLG